MNALRARTGFTLAEVAVAAAIVAMLAAVTAPYFVRFIDKQRAQTTADKLSDLADGIASFGAAVRTAAATTSTTYPGLISELANQITSNTTVTHNSCGTLGTTGTFNATATNNWSLNGPFVTFYVPTGGLKTPLGIVEDSMKRTPSAATAGTLSLRMLNVASDDAQTLDLIVDGGDGGTSGIVRYTDNGNGTYNIEYLVPVKAKC